MSTPAPTFQARITGKGINRLDGRLKVTGAARYSAEFTEPDLLYAWPVRSTVARGKILGIETEKAAAAPGVKWVLTHLNKPEAKEPKPDREKGGGIRNEERLPLGDDQVHYAGQYVALVLAESLHEARHGASLVTVQYEAWKPALTHEENRQAGQRPEKNSGDPVQAKKGEVEKALGDPSLVVIERIYQTPRETHSPMEPSAALAHWPTEDSLVLHDATQFVKGVQDIAARTFGLDPEKVTVISPFVGGAFGCKGAVWPHVLLTAMAAKAAGRPVKFALPRQDMFTSTGHRTPTFQTIGLAASRDGRLQGIRHVTETRTSPIGQYVESVGWRSSGVMYACPNITIEETIIPVNHSTPTFMRAPGECPGTYALESAMDELAAELKLDPLDLRLANYAKNHPLKDTPYSAKFLKEAYGLGAEKFGWMQRSSMPGSMKAGGKLLGWGMATATYPAYMMRAEARAVLRADGTALVQCATHDLGTGAYTAFTQISADALGIEVEKVKFELGNSSLPYGPVAGGSNSTATVGTAIFEAAKDLHARLAELAVKDPDSPLRKADPAEITAGDGGTLQLVNNSNLRDSFTDILRRAGKESIEGQGSYNPATSKPSPPPFAFQSFGVHFCEVTVDPAIMKVRVSRMVSVMNCGRVINEKTARNQIMGGVVMGIGMALQEETVSDSTNGMTVTRHLADYHVPVNADIPDLEVYFVGEPDLNFNPIGARGLGEIGITGTAAAVANAVYHATGKRVRDLPITVEKLLI